MRRSESSSISSRIGGWLTVAAVALAAGAASPGASGALACGYHSRSDLERGLLNWSFPNALYVRTAVWQAEDAGILPPRPRAPVRDLFAFNRALKHLNALGAKLDAARPSERLRASFSIVQIDSMLWTRFEWSGDGYAVQSHVSGPSQGDVVVVTDGKVVAAMVGGSLNAERAERYGLLRYYGVDADQAAVRDTLAAATANVSRS